MATDLTQNDGQKSRHGLGRLALLKKPQSDLSFTPGFSPVMNGYMRCETVLTVSSSVQSTKAIELFVHSGGRNR
jgi:hypothetical protein